MKTITLTQAYNLLQNASAILIDDVSDPIIHCMAELDGSEENQFLYISWDDAEGLMYDVKFAEGENQNVTISETSMFLTDIEGEEVQITLLIPQILEVE
jgi:hypothetical protein